MAQTQKKGKSAPRPCVDLIIISLKVENLRFDTLFLFIHTTFKEKINYDIENSFIKEKEKILKNQYFDYKETILFISESLLAKD